MTDILVSRYDIIKHILGLLFTAEERRHIKNCDKMVDQNSEVSKKQLDGFMYEGRFFRHTRAAAGAGVRTTLHLSLWPDMRALLRDRKQVEDDEALIRQTLFRLLDAAAESRDLQDVRNAIPECIIDTLPDQVRALQRTREPESFLVHARDLKQYERAIVKIEFYSATRMLY